MSSFSPWSTRKWHMGNDDTARPGFDHWVSMKGQGTSFDPLLNIDGQRQSFAGHTTAFIFTSDHGYWYGEHGLSVERRLAYEEAIRIPLLIRYPRLTSAGGRRAGSIIDDFALSIDLAPTLLELSGASEKMHVDGRSLVPLLRGERPRDWRTSMLIQYNSDTVFPRVQQMGYRAIRTQRWKFIRYIELAGMNELYDLINDPYEMKNLIVEPQAQAVLSDLNSQLDELLKD